VSCTVYITHTDRTTAEIVARADRTTHLLQVVQRDISRAQQQISKLEVFQNFVEVVIC
jgi:hypothetical protein